MQIRCIIVHFQSSNFRHGNWKYIWKFFEGDQDSHTSTSDPIKGMLKFNDKSLSSENGGEPKWKSKKNKSRECISLRDQDQSTCEQF